MYSVEYDINLTRERHLTNYNAAAKEDSLVAVKLLDLVKIVGLVLKINYTNYPTISSLSSASYCTFPNRHTRQNGALCEHMLYREVHVYYTLQSHK